MRPALATLFPFFWHVVLTGTEVTYDKMFALSLLLLRHFIDTDVEVIYDEARGRCSATVVDCVFCSLSDPMLNSFSSTLD